MGHVIGGEGVATDPTEVAAVREWRAPSNVAELPGFLGLPAYYRRFIKGFATIASPLHQLTQKGRDFQWSEDCATTFFQLHSAPVLAFLDPERIFIGDTDEMPALWAWAPRRGSTVNRSSPTSAAHSASQRRTTVSHTKSCWLLSWAFVISDHNCMDRGSSCGLITLHLPGC